MPSVDLLKAAVLDTHVWVWASAGDARAGALEHFRGRSIVSAISVWEVAMLAEKQRLVLSPGVEEWIGANLRPPVELEPIHPSVAIASARLKDFHGDPADRIIVATAMLLGVPLVTADQKIIAWARAGGSVSVVGL